jgi:hypothetical protein
MRFQRYNIQQALSSPLNEHTFTTRTVHPALVVAVAVAVASLLKPVQY